MAVGDLSFSVGGNFRLGDVFAEHGVIHADIIGADYAADFETLVVLVDLDPTLTFDDHVAIGKNLLHQAGDLGGEVTNLSRRTGPGGGAVRGRSKSIEQARKKRDLCQRSVVGILSARCRRGVETSRARFLNKNRDHVANSSGTSIR